MLAALSKRGIEIRLITSRVDYNIKALDVLRACENQNLTYLILDKEYDRTVFIHAKIYLIDKKFAVSGSANLTYSGFNTNVETLSIAETEQEVQQIERDFMNIWLKYERQSLTKEELSKGTARSIDRALPLNIRLDDNKNAQLTFYPYFFYEFIFRGSVRNPPLLFEDKGLLAVDGINRQIIVDHPLINEINNKQPTDYLVHTENKFDLEIVSSIISSFKEASEIALDYIIRKNTREYYQNYGSRSYKRLYVPRKYEITFLKNYFVNVPVWNYDALFSDKLVHNRLVYGSTGTVWKDRVYCPTCKNLIAIEGLVQCSDCGKLLCPKCYREKGLIFKKKICSPCFNTPR